MPTIPGRASATPHRQSPPPVAGIAHKSAPRSAMRSSGGRPALHAPAPCAPVDAAPLHKGSRAISSIALRAVRASDTRPPNAPPHPATAVIAATQFSGGLGSGHRFSNSSALPAAFFSRCAWSFNNSSGCSNTRPAHVPGVLNRNGSLASTIRKSYSIPGHIPAASGPMGPATPPGLLTASWHGFLAPPPLNPTEGSCASPPRISFHFHCCSPGD